MIFECYKARLATKGYGRMNGVDKEETFNAVTKVISLKGIVAAVASVLDYASVDVKIVFLHNELQVEVLLCG